MKHRKGCKLRLALASVGVECEHGFDVCPTCDRCTCLRPLMTYAQYLREVSGG